MDILTVLKTAQDTCVSNLSIDMPFSIEKLAVERVRVLLPCRMAPSVGQVSTGKEGCVARTRRLMQKNKETAEQKAKLPGVAHTLYSSAVVLHTSKATARRRQACDHNKLPIFKRN